MWDSQKEKVLKLQYLYLNSKQAKRTTFHIIKISVKCSALSPAVTLKSHCTEWLLRALDLWDTARICLKAFFWHMDIFRNICNQEMLSLTGPKSQREKLLEIPRDWYLEGELTVWKIKNVTQLLPSFIQLSAHFKVEPLLVYFGVIAQICFTDHNADMVIFRSAWTDDRKWRI